MTSQLWLWTKTCWPWIRSVMCSGTISGGRLWQTSRAINPTGPWPHYLSGESIALNVESNFRQKENLGKFRYISTRISLHWHVNLSSSDVFEGWVALGKFMRSYLVNFKLNTHKSLESLLNDWQWSIKVLFCNSCEENRCSERGQSALWAINMNRFGSALIFIVLPLKHPFT